MPEDKTQSQKTPAQSFWSSTVYGAKRKVSSKATKIETTSAKPETKQSTQPITSQHLQQQFKEIYASKNIKYSNDITTILEKFQKYVSPEAYNTYCNDIISKAKKVSIPIQMHDLKTHLDIGLEACQKLHNGENIINVANDMISQSQEKLIMSNTRTRAEALAQIGILYPETGGKYLKEHMNQEPMKSYYSNNQRSNNVLESGMYKTQSGKNCMVTYDGISINSEKIDADYIRYTNSENNPKLEAYNKGKCVFMESATPIKGIKPIYTDETPQNSTKYNQIRTQYLDENATNKVLNEYHQAKSQAQSPKYQQTFFDNNKLGKTVKSMVSGLRQSFNDEQQTPQITTPQLPQIGGNP